MRLDLYHRDRQPKTYYVTHIETGTIREVEALWAAEAIRAAGWPEGDVVVQCETEAEYGTEEAMVGMLGRVRELGRILVALPDPPGFEGELALMGWLHREFEEATILIAGARG